MNTKLVDFKCVGNVIGRVEIPIVKSVCAELL